MLQGGGSSAASGAGEQPESVFPVFDPASPQADAIRHVFDQVLVLSAVLFAIVAGLLIVAAVRFRAKPGVEPKQDFGSEKTEIVWALGPILVVFWLVAITTKLVWAVNAMPEAHPPKKAEYDLVVTGHQWWWEVEYVGSGVVGAGEIHVPVGKKLLVDIRSADVIHCFWVPRLARKIDAIPGWENHLWLEADEAGIYQGRCAEFCGTQHANMSFQVIAHEPADFDAWLAARSTPRATPTDPEVMAGAAAFASATCGDCHAVAGTDAEADFAPDLTHFATRRFIGSGVLENTPENLERWLRDPGAVKPGCKMPNFQLDPTELAHLIAYLETMR